MLDSIELSVALLALRVEKVRGWFVVNLPTWRNPISHLSFAILKNVKHASPCYSIAEKVSVVRKEGIDQRIENSVTNKIQVEISQKVS